MDFTTFFFHTRSEFFFETKYYFCPCLQHYTNQLFYEFFQVVVAMRDLFQVVFELKQKEIDDALRKMDKDKRVINSYKQLPYNSVSSTKKLQKIIYPST